MSIPIQNLVTQLTGQITALQIPANISGNNLAFSIISGLTGQFNSLSANQISSTNFYNNANNLLTQTNGFYAGSLPATTAMTGTQSLTFNTIVNRNTAIAATGPTTITVGANTWNRVCYTLVSTVPANAKVSAVILAGTGMISDSISTITNYPPTETLGVISATTATATLSGLAHSATTVSVPISLQVTCTTGTYQLLNGTLELQSLQ